MGKKTKKESFSLFIQQFVQPYKYKWVVTISNIYTATTTIAINQQLFHFFFFLFLIKENGYYYHHH